MALLPILSGDDPRLRAKARKVRTIDASIQRLIDDMVDTMRDANGVGLAANQVGVLLRVVVTEIPEEPVRALINPEIVKASDEEVMQEGCLSVPGLHGTVRRCKNVTVKALDRTGKAVRYKAEDLFAQCLQHEIDHLNGILYTDKAETLEPIPERAPAQVAPHDEVPQPAEQAAS
ncbi:MAG: peptide deformylase [Chloroflexi bacterium]|nr:peptide deformylase [Chloroflexota bacterium]